MKSNLIANTRLSHPSQWPALWHSPLTGDILTLSLTGPCSVCNHSWLPHLYSLTEYLVSAEWCQEGRERERESCPHRFPSSPGPPPPAHILLRGHSGFKGAWISQWFSTHPACLCLASSPLSSLGSPVNAHNSCSATIQSHRRREEPVSSSLHVDNLKASANRINTLSTLSNRNSHQLSYLCKTATNYNLLRMPPCYWLKFPQLHVDWVLDMERPRSRSSVSSRSSVYHTTLVFYTLTRYSKHHQINLHIGIN